MDGSLTLQEVEENWELLLHSTGQALGISKSDAFKAIAEKEPCAQAEAMAFIQEMGGWPFYKALCVITQEGALLTPLEQRIREEIVHPSFCKPMPKGVLLRVWYKLQRIWKPRWKHPLVYKEWWLPALVTKVWCWVKGEKYLKER